ncbi:MAG: conjugal transfer pilus assembly protein TraD [Pseudomonadota bacterium]|nr:conjugal transfer pilus assembly protein TraD [Pseudomonadota bacterium]
MLANQKLTPFKWAVIYYNRFIFAFAICLIGFNLFINWMKGGYCQPFLSYIIVGLVGLLVYEILYQSRAVLFNMGHTRFYFLIILFYVPFLINAFIFNDFLLIRVPFSLALRPDDLSSIFFYKLGIFGVSIGVIWFIFGVEFEKPSRKEMDIKALLVDDKKLHAWNNNLVISAYIVSTLVIALYSIFLAILVAIILSLQHILSRKVAIILALVAAVLCLILAIDFKFNALNLANGWINYFMNYGLVSLIEKELYSFKNTLNIGVTLISAPLFLIIALAKLRLNSTDLRNIEEYLKDVGKDNAQDGSINIGINPITKKNVLLTEKELNSHALYIGTTGGGKTTAILCNVEHCAINGIPCILMDGKGSPDLPQKIKYLADKYNRKFKLFTVKPEALSKELQECLAAYNPFAVGTHTEWKNRLMSLFAEVEGRGQQHFALQEEAKLNLLMQLIKTCGVRVDLKLVLDYITDPEIIKTFAQKTEDLALIKEVYALYPDEISNKKQTGDIELILKLFINSSYGHLFNTGVSKSVIELQQSVINDEIVLFMLDSSAFKEDTKKLAKMVINDINSAFSTIKERTGTIKNCFCIFDEFASYASSNLSDTLTLHRSNGLHAIIGTQSLTAISLISYETARVAEELISCCGTYLVLQLQHNEDIERIAKIFGTQESFEVTRQIDVSEGGGATGMGSTKRIDEFIVHPKMIRNLSGNEGTGYIYRKTYGQKPFKIILRRVVTD